jgi:hypothetical protein
MEGGADECVKSISFILAAVSQKCRAHSTDHAGVLQVPLKKRQSCDCEETMQGTHSPAASPAP